MMGCRCHVPDEERRRWARAASGGRGNTWLRRVGGSGMGVVRAGCGAKARVQMEQCQGFTCGFSSSGKRGEVKGATLSTHHTTAGSRTRGTRSSKAPSRPPRYKQQDPSTKQSEELSLIVVARELEEQRGRSRSKAVEPLTTYQHCTPPVPSFLFFPSPFHSMFHLHHLLVQGLQILRDLLLVQVRQVHASAAAAVPSAALLVLYLGVGERWVGGQKLFPSIALQNKTKRTCARRPRGLYFSSTAMSLGVWSLG